MKELIHELFVEGVPTHEIAAKVGLKHNALKMRISRYRKNDPQNWNYRNDYPQRTVTSIMKVYECEDCCLTFALESAYKEHSDACCPICWSNDHMRFVGDSQINIKI